MKPELMIKQPVLTKEQADILAHCDSWKDIFGEIDETIVRFTKNGWPLITSPRVQIQKRYRELKKKYEKGSLERKKLLEAFDLAMRELRV